VCHQRAVRALAILLVLAVILAVAGAAAGMLLLVLRRQGTRIASLEAEKRALAAQVDRMALLDRRQAACAPLDHIWYCWASCTPPYEDALQAAALAAEAARRLFPADLEPDLDEVARHLIALSRHRGRQHDAVLGERHGERVALLEEEAEMERRLKAKLVSLRILLADACRPGGL
jgi:hypothetical protein